MPSVSSYFSFITYTDPASRFRRFTAAARTVILPETVSEPGSGMIRGDFAWAATQECPLPPYRQHPYRTRQQILHDHIRPAISLQPSL